MNLASIGVVRIDLDDVHVFLIKQEKALLNFVAAARVNIACYLACCVLKILH